MLGQSDVVVCQEYGGHCTLVIEMVQQAGICCFCEVDCMCNFISIRGYLSTTHINITSTLQKVECVGSTQLCLVDLYSATFARKGSAVKYMCCILFLQVVKFQDVKYFECSVSGLTSPST